MIEAKKILGILNTDYDIGEVQPNEHIDARNVVFRDGRAQNIKGTRLLANNNLPVAGINKNHGKYYDELNQRLFFFNYNSTGKNGIYYVDTKTGIVYPLLVSLVNSQTDIFNFDINFPIEYIDILYTTEADGDILHWTDRFNRPMKLNIKDAINNIYGAFWLKEYLTVARKMPLLAPVCTYSDDSASPVNNLKKKLYQFFYQYTYKDFTKSTWSPYSKLFAPANSDDLATDTDPLKNNRINVTIQTGSADVSKITIGARHQNIGATYTDPFEVEVLDKIALGLDHNVPYVYYFYNTLPTIPIEITERNLLFWNIPKKANAQAMLNGNVLDYAGITEGFTSGITPSVVGTVSLVNNGVSTSPFTIRTQNNQVYSGGGWSGNFYIYFSGIPQSGDVIQIIIVAENGAGQTALTMNYTVLAGDNMYNVEQYFRTTFNSNIFATNMALSANDQPAFEGFYLYSTNGISRVILVQPTVTLINPPSPSTNDVNIAAYKHKSKYRFGLVYFDEFGVTDGVITNVNFIINTPEMDTSGLTQMKIPAIKFQVSHQPPVGAKYFSWVRSENLTVAGFIATFTASTKKTADYAYLEIGNQQNNKSNFSTYEFLEGDRVRIIGVFGSSVPTVYDTAIIGVVTNPETFTGVYIKVAYAANLTTFGTDNRWYIEPYTPAKNSTLSSQSFYEFGETYLIGDAGLSTRFHLGQQQDQIIGVGAQPAIYNFTRGDVYIRQRLLPALPDGTGPVAEWIMDRSVSDKYPSKVIGNGRTFVIDPYAKETYYPTLNRYSLDYQQDTNINRTNQFYSANYQQYDRQRGDVMGLNVVANRLHVFQKRGCGMCGINETLLSNADGSSNLIRTDTILNPIHYYVGKYGVGDQYSSLVRTKTNSYFSDPVTGEQCRLSLSGVDVISKQYKGQYYLAGLIRNYSRDWIMSNGSKARIMGFFDHDEDQFVTILQPGTISSETTAAFTFAFKERAKGVPSYTSFYDIFAEAMLSADNVNYGWFAGRVYKFDSNTYNNFFGVQYPASITFPFNERQLLKKAYQSLSQEANKVWASPLIYTDTFSYGNQRQESNLVSTDYKFSKGRWESKFRRDVNSIGGVSDGDKLKGNLIAIKFEALDASSLVYISLVEVKYNDQHLTPS